MTRWPHPRRRLCGIERGQWWCKWCWWMVQHFELKFYGHAGGWLSTSFLSPPPRSLGSPRAVARPIPACLPKLGLGKLNIGGGWAIVSGQGVVGNCVLVGEWTVSGKWVGGCTGKWLVCRGWVVGVKCTLIGERLTCRSVGRSVGVGE